MDKKRFDEIIKSNLIIKEGSDKSFIEKKPYYALPAYNRFVSEMQKKYPRLYRLYYKGKGSELKANGGKMPKMASVASSSRFCYIALRDIAGKTVEVEKPLRIKKVKGTCPQMDAYIKEDNAFIEVKCHEIFDTHAIKLSKQYWKYLFGAENSFGFEAKDEPGDDSFEIDLQAFDFDKNPEKFDFKQFLCHLLGIAYSSDEKSRGDKAKLVYLFFKPVCDDTDMDIVFDELKVELKAIFDNKHIKAFCAAHSIELYAIMQNAPVMESLDITGYNKLYP